MSVLIVIKAAVSLLSALTLLEATIVHVWMALMAMDSTVQVLVILLVFCEWLRKMCVVFLVS